MTADKIKEEALKRYLNSKEVEEQISEAMKAISDSTDPEASKLFGGPVIRNTVGAAPAIYSREASVFYSVGIVSDSHRKIYFNPYEDKTEHQKQFDFFVKNVDLSKFSEQFFNLQEPWDTSTDELKQHLTRLRTQTITLLSSIPDSNVTKKDAADVLAVVSDDNKWADYFNTQLAKFQEHTTVEDTMRAKRNDDSTAIGRIIDGLKKKFINTEQPNSTNKP